MVGTPYEVPPELDVIAGKCVNSAFRVHQALGPGPQESVYEACLLQELLTAGLKVKRQVPLPIVYRGVKIGEGLRLDLTVEDSLIIEVKSVSELHDVHLAQILTYLKLADYRLGLLINFNSVLIKKGIRRVINPPRPSE